MLVKFRSTSLVAVSSIVLLLAGCTKECLPPQGNPSGVKMMNPRAMQDAGDQRTNERRAILKLGGRFCEFNLPGVQEALMKVPGVTAVDLETVQGAAVVTYEAGNVNPIALLSAVRTVKGDGYYCTARISD